MDYIGEHLLPGQLGHFFIILSLVATGVATLSYFLSVRSASDEEAKSWKKLARWAFITECISVFAIFGLLFYIIMHGNTAAVHWK
jgi:cytochrome c-type biogenesis protein CcmF